MTLLADLEKLLYQRKHDLPENSYTSTLFKGGVDRILKKVGEEAGEVIIAAKNESQAELVHECADLFFHVLVLLVSRGVPLAEVELELQKRHKP
jgi:phosphoribosyl-ATP pyrophosphohydrolase